MKSIRRARELRLLFSVFLEAAAFSELFYEALNDILICLCKGQICRRPGERAQVYLSLLE